MHEFYDVCPYSSLEQEERLRAARVLSQADIRCLVHGEDALAFVHFVPTGLFGLNLVVANHDIHRAVAEVIRILPYRVFTGIHDHYNNPLYCDPNRTRSYPNSTFLEIKERNGSDPYMIIIHPESEFNLVIRDCSRSVSLPPFPDNIRFPTRPALLDSVIETRLDPNSGLVTKRTTETLETWLVYVIQYTLRRRPIVLPNGNLDPESDVLLRSLRPENQLQFEAYLRRALHAGDRSRHMTLRRERLRSMGNVELAERSLPRVPPGNPEYMAQRWATMQARRALEQAQPQASSIPQRVATPSSSPSSQNRPYSNFASKGVSSSLRLARKFVR